MSENLAERGRAGLIELVRQHPFFADLHADDCALVAGCAKNVRFEADTPILREGEPANEFYLLRDGRAALEVKGPGQPPVTFQTVGPGEIVGVSWLVPPYRWTYDARAAEPVRAIALDAACLRGKCDDDPALGYAMMKSFVPILVKRLQATRLQLLDLYGNHG